jgi:hypothetical protein
VVPWSLQDDLHHVFLQADGVSDQHAAQIFVSRIFSQTFPGGALGTVQTWPQASHS